MVKAVIFDLDDTLVSERQYIDSGFRHVSKVLSEKYNKSEIYLYTLLNELFNKSPKMVFNRLFAKLGIDYTQENIKWLVKEYRCHPPSLTFFNDVIPCLEILEKRGIKSGIITDGYACTQRKKLEAVSAYNYFDNIIITDELGREYWKPHPKPYNIMKNKLNLEYHEMVYLGDNISKDFITAKKLGMKTVRIKREGGLYNNIQKPPEYKAHRQIKSLYEFIKLLKD